MLYTAAADMIRSKRPARTIVTTYFPSPLPHTEQTIAFLAFFLFGCCFFARPVALDLAMLCLVGLWFVVFGVGVDLGFQGPGNRPLVAHDGTDTFATSSNYSEKHNMS